MSNNAAFSDTLTVSDDGWRLIETGWDPDRSVAVGSNFMVGNGYLGYRGTSPEQGPEDFVALVVSDTYDCADGRWRELTTAPNPLYVSASIDGRSLVVRDASHVETTLDLRSGEFSSTVIRTVGETEIRIHGRADGQLYRPEPHRPTMDAEHISDISVELAAGIDGPDLGSEWHPSAGHHLRSGSRDSHCDRNDGRIEVTVAVAAHIDLPGAEHTDGGGRAPQQDGVSRSIVAVGDRNCRCGVVVERRRRPSPKDVRAGAAASRTGIRTPS